MPSRPCTHIHSFDERKLAKNDGAPGVTGDPVHSSVRVLLARGRSTSDRRVPLQRAHPSASRSPMTSSFLPAKLDTMWLLIDAPAVLEGVGAVPWLRLPRAQRPLPGRSA